jgi:hypothetical protein
MSEIEDVRCGDARFDSLVKPCGNDPTRFQFRVKNADEIKPLCDERGINLQPEKLQLLKNLHGRSTMTWPETKDWLIEASPQMGNLFAVWDRCIVKCYTLTNVGKVIGHAHFRGRTKREFDQKWDRTLSEERHWSISPFPG